MLPDKKALAREVAQETILKMELLRVKAKIDQLHPLAGMVLLAQECARGAGRVRNILFHQDPPASGGSWWV